MTTTKVARAAAGGTPFSHPEVARVFAAYPAPAQAAMLALRELILSTAAETPGVGEIEETLRWGEPAYVTSQTRSGSTVRIDWKPARPGHCAVYFHCQTNLVDTFRTLFRREFEFEGHRAIVLDLAAPLTRDTRDALAYCVAASLTYHLNKRRAGAARVG